MGLYQTFVRPLAFAMDAERAHDLAITAGAVAGGLPPVRGLLSACYGHADERLETEVCGIHFANPIGLAAGYDKSGRAVRALAALGFGHVEVGSVSLDASSGNPKPRLFRLAAESAIVVNYGLPNDGAASVAARLNIRRTPVPLGLNVVKTNRGPDAPPASADDIIAEYVAATQALSDVADYLSLNLSCPNTETGRNFFADPEAITGLLDALADARIGCPVFLKVAPAAGARAIEDLLAAVEGCALVSGFIFNLPPGKPDSLKTPAALLADKPGAVSGKPVERLINESIRELYRRMDRSRYVIVGSGGVFTAEGAYRKMRLGASLVQVLTGLIYRGPSVVKQINRGLVALLARDGLAHVSEAVGLDA